MQKPPPEALFARAAAAIAESRQLSFTNRVLLAEMTAIYERRMISAMKAARGLRDSEQKLVERYRRLTQTYCGGEASNNAPKRTSNEA